MSDATTVTVDSPVDDLGSMVQLLAPEGVRVAHPHYDVTLSAQEMVGLYRDMVVLRRLDTEAMRLQRQGELGLWASSRGQEGAQIGAGRALGSTDFAFTSYREHGIAWCLGVPPERWLPFWRGTAHSGWNPDEYRMAIPAVVIGAQALHAVGYAMGIQRDAADAAVLACFGDGATAQGDVNEAFVWAAAQRAPVVFFCQNNQWAISEPLARQTPIPLYRRAGGFGFEGTRVDGNDVLACLAVTKQALADARSGHHCPILIEAHTYRMAGHTTSDDPGRYRSAAEVDAWAERDPIVRLEVYLRKQPGVAPGFVADVAAEAEVLASDLRARCLAQTDPPIDDLFEAVFTDDATGSAVPPSVAEAG